MQLLYLTAGLILASLSSLFSLTKFNFEKSQQVFYPEDSLSFATLDAKLDEALPARFSSFPPAVLLL